MKKLTKCVIVLFVFFSVCFSKSYAQWSAVGSPGFSANGAYYTSLNTSLYVYNDTPFVAYLDGYSPKATVMKYDGTNWVNVGSPDFSAGEAAYISLFVYSGTPYVAYQDVGNSYKATVMKYNGINWINVGSAGFSAGPAADISLFVYSGFPIVAYQDGGNGDKATVMEYDGTNWIGVGSPGFSAGAANFTSLYVYNGTPYVAYGDVGNSGKATVMEYTGGNWVDVGSAGFSAGAAQYTSLSVYNGTPYVAYLDAGNGNKATLMKDTGAKWVNVGSPGFSAGQAAYISLFVYSGTPYVAYQDAVNGYKATVMEYTGGNWVDVGSAGFSAGATKCTSLSVYNGTPYVAYQDDGNGYKATVMKYTAPLPVELKAFTANKLDNKVELKWKTATEINNYGFEVQRSNTPLQFPSQEGKEQSGKSVWENVGFVKGAGTTNSTKTYSFTDDNPLRGKVEYRLKQENNDGTFKYSSIVTVNSVPDKFELSQNYPNPFNPTTTIQYAIPQSEHVTLKVYDELGNEVRTLVNGEKSAGEYNVEFNGSNLSSGIYFYKISAGNYSEVKKLMLLK